ncbi:MAG: beta-propeller domain-containing protein [Polyangiales bacterium]
MRLFSAQELRRFGRGGENLRMGAEGASMGSLQGLGGLSASASGASMSTPTSASASPSSSSSITNTQVAGIDEGDIVKALGEHFIVLRRGVLFSVSAAESGLTVQDQAHVQLPDQGEGWIDELLVHHRTRTLIVTGFVSGPDGRDYTLYHLFTLETDGQIVRGDALFFPSMDYFGEEDYATRMVGDNLVTYSVHEFQTEYALLPDDLEGLEPDEVAQMRRQGRFDYALPQVRRGPSGRFERTWSPRRTFREQGREATTLHAITSCHMGRAPVRCRTRSVLADGDARLFVSHSAAYLWMNEMSYVPEGQGEEPSEEGNASPLYRFPHRRSNVQSVAVAGETLGALSFRESGGSLRALVFVPDAGATDAESEEESEVELALLTIPLRTFGQPLHWRDYRPLPGAHPGSVRFVGDAHVLYGDGRTFVHNIDTAETCVFDEVAPERIDPLGPGAALVSWNERDSLNYAIIDVRNMSRAREMRALQGATSSETRTHGFFYQPDAQGGSFGMPVVASTFASVAYFDVRDHHTTLVGSLSADALDSEEECENSCTDWYGNARPIFWRERVFALLGSELVEGARVDGRITERARVRLVPGPRSTAD